MITPMANAADSDNTFTIVWITDTQFLSQIYPSDNDKACNWIVNNAAALNLKAVIHTGDLTNNANDDEFTNAARSMGILLSNNIPYCWCAGNHDAYVSQNYQAFKTSTMNGKPYWVSDYNSGMNTAISFNYSNTNFLLIDIAYNADNAALQWANNLLISHPTSWAIIGTHGYLDPENGYDSWANNLRATVLDTHPNVFLTLNGHFHPVGLYAARTTVGNRTEMFFNRQDQDGYEGAATIRLLTFNPTTNTIAVKTFNTLQNYYLTDPDNQFTLNANTSIPIPEGLPIPAIIILFIAVIAGSTYLAKSPKIRNINHPLT